MYCVHDKLLTMSLNVDILSHAHMQRFTADTHLSCGVDCSYIFPSPPAIQRAVRKVPVPLQNEILDHRISTLISHHGNSVVLHESAFIGVGGNGVVLKQALNGRKYAIKWVSCMLYM